MKLLVIDPGITTGFVLFSDINRLEIEHQGDVSDLDIDVWVTRIASRLSHNDHVVVERIPIPPMGPLGSTLQHIVFVIQNQFPNAEYVLPGAWKPVTKSVRSPVGVSKHQRDAYRLGWYFSKRMNHDK